MTTRTRARPVAPHIGASTRTWKSKLDPSRQLKCCLAAGIVVLVGVTLSPNAAAATSRSHPAVVVSTRFIRGVGTVLVNARGRTLYSPIQERGGKIKCTGACQSFWFPLTTSSKVAIDAGRISSRFSELKRPGSVAWQVAYEGQPLYTFRFDNSAGETKGNGFVDHFGGMTFDWRAVVVSGSAKTTPPTTTPYSSGGGGY
jgi:predicted lipoprotein with Yx(FWY)xxD motif